MIFFYITDEKFSLIDITFYNNLPLFYHGYVMEMQASAFSFAKQN